MIEFPYYCEHGERGRAAAAYGEGLTRGSWSRVSRSSSTRTALEELGITVVGTPSKSYLGVPIVPGDDGDRRDQRAEHRRGGPVRRGRRRVCSRRSRRTSASRSRTRGCSRRGTPAARDRVAGRDRARAGDLLDLDPVRRIARAGAGAHRRRHERGVFGGETAGAASSPLGRSTSHQGRTIAPGRGSSASSRTRRGGGRQRRLGDPRPVRSRGRRTTARNG